MIIKRIEEPTYVIECHNQIAVRRRDTPEITMATISVPYHAHPLRLSPTDLDWACDARHLPRGCRRGFGGATRGIPRYTCTAGCNYDVCDDCAKIVSSQSHSALDAAFADLPSLLASLGTHVEESVTSTLHPHPLVLKRASAAIDWACDARDHPQGCGRGFGGSTRGRDRYNCAACNFDLCHDCIRIGGAPGSAPAAAAAAGAPAASEVRKRALIIGIKYSCRPPLTAAIVGRVRSLRVVSTTRSVSRCSSSASGPHLARHADCRFGYTEGNMRLLLEDGSDPSQQPTKANILEVCICFNACSLACGTYCRDCSGWRVVPAAVTTCSCTIAATERRPQIRVTTRRTAVTRCSCPWTTHALVSLRCTLS
jgi:hypothetical protein